MQQQQKTKGIVIPLAGYLESPPQEPTPPSKPTAGLFGMIAIALIGGCILGAVSVHQSTAYQDLQRFKDDSQQLQQLKKTICYGG